MNQSYIFIQLLRTCENPSEHHVSDIGPLGLLFKKLFWNKTFAIKCYETAIHRDE